tara:strand:+ start:2844 stop:3125 length:282 start_codon:yes stop_codon:yes gene_type:complete
MTSVGGLNNGLTAGMSYGVANGMNGVVNLHNRKVGSIAPTATFTTPYFEGRDYTRKEIGQAAYSRNTYSMPGVSSTGFAMRGGNQQTGWALRM